MKKSFVTVSTILMLGSGFVYGDSPEFAEVDANQDGMLNKQEADTALPALGIRDSDEDGVISKAEVKLVLPEISFSETDTSAVGESDYQQIVAVIEERMNQNNS